MRKLWLSAAGLAIVALAVYFVGTNDGSNVASKNIDEQRLKQIVSEYSAGVRTAASASISSDRLTVVSGDDVTTEYPLPKDEFFLSIAPYIENTHPCAIHSLTGCRGELANMSFDVTIEDSDGRTVFDRAVTSQPNGFIDLWLPRDDKYRVTIERDGLSTTSTISTFEGDNTCIATMRLS
ncbi:hypothetical protein FE782_08775 [Paenibacillus antri]|uniref:CueP family metal-binding protein n=1 Tax=Paenibacillus antri TaxID=2582848 RepID=A0A5R9G8I2_9BACL|nr:CueP family metal-binding protein [Paenibacillus antri]TLS52712.1 hypothetical protein FE782_08775 [Paenibacillus antri]